MPSYEIRGYITISSDKGDREFVIVKNLDENIYHEIDVSNEQDVVQAVARKLKVDKSRITVPKHVKLQKGG